MTVSEDVSSENAAHILPREYDRLFLIEEINEVLANMSLQELKKTLDLIEIARK